METRDWLIEKRHAIRENSEPWSVQEVLVGGRIVRVDKFVYPAPPRGLPAGFIRLGVNVKTLSGFLNWFRKHFSTNFHRPFFPINLL